MIQRIQTLWLALIVVLCIANLFFPLAIFNIQIKDMPEDAVYRLLPTSSSFYQSSPAWTTLIFNGIVCILSLVTIFLYKNRVLQLKVLAFAFLACVVEVALLFFYQIDAGLETIITSLYRGTPELIKPNIEASKITYTLGSYFPIFEVIFFIFARNAIRKDEMRVRASDRLR